MSKVVAALRLQACAGDDVAPRFGRLIGESAGMREVFDRLERIAARDTTVLLEAESGTGKELAAHAIHEASLRRNGPFVVVDCAALARTLIETELFGHERGAYTGASHSRRGAFARANGGTVFLDEVAELDLELQPRLLRVLEQREIKPIGSAHSIPIDVRIIAATNRNLRREVAEGTFRQDLYYRLAIACVRLPALRDRLSDIPLLVRHFIQEYSRHENVEYSTEWVLAQLPSSSWPGNVRELRNAVEQIIAFGADTGRDVPLDVPGAYDPTILACPFKVAKAQLLQRFEREYLVTALAHHGGNITAAANHAELDRVHFLRLLDRYGLRASRSRAV